MKADTEWYVKERMGGRGSRAREKKHGECLSRIYTRYGVGERERERKRKGKSMNLWNDFAFFFQFSSNFQDNFENVIESSEERVARLWSFENETNSFYNRMNNAILCDHFQELNLVFPLIQMLNGYISSSPKRNGNVSIYRKGIASLDSINWSPKKSSSPLRQPLFISATENIELAIECFEGGLFICFLSFNKNNLFCFDLFISLLSLI